MISLNSFQSKLCYLSVPVSVTVAVVTFLALDTALVASKTFVIDPIAPNKPAVSAGIIKAFSELLRLPATFVCAFNASSGR